MNLEEFKLRTLGIDKEKFQRIFTFVDFGNVNYWYEKDRTDFDNNLLSQNQKLIVGIEKLSCFINLFSTQKRFYYGLDQRDKSTWHITYLADRYNFIVNKKPIQWIKHYLEVKDKNIKLNHKIRRDRDGIFIEIPKCNFDVEITIDAIRLVEHYDTFALFSGDSDFSMLLKFLRRKGKRIILFYAGRISYSLKNYADLLVNAQKIKSSICILKEIKKNPL
jgi:uncharacterized LabA/DUF88 family protein